MPTLDELKKHRQSSSKKVGHGLFPSLMSREAREEISIREFIQRIQEGEWKAETEKCRRLLKEGNEVAAKSLKKTLPGLCIGRLGKRRKTGAPSDLCLMDFDGGENESVTSPITLATLQSDPHVLAGMVSISGKGVKLIVRGPKGLDDHKRLWLSAEKYFKNTHNLTADAAAKDVVRLCGVTWDEKAWYLNDAKTIPLVELPKPPPPPAEFSPSSMEEEDIAELLAHIPPNPHYDDWLLIASAVWSVLPMEAGCQLLNQWSPEQQEGEYARKWKSRLKNAHVGILVNFAKRNGFDARAAFRRKRFLGHVVFRQRPPKEGENKSDQFPIHIPDEAELENYRPIDAIKIIENIDRQHFGHAENLVSVWPQEAIFDRTIGEWRFYKNGIWEIDDKEHLPSMVEATLRNLYLEISQDHAKKISETKDEGKQKQIANDCKLLRKSASTICSVTYLKNIIEAMKKSGRTRNATDFTAHPHLVPVENGIIDLKQEIILPHCSSYHFAHCLNAPFVENATCPKFDDFLSMVMNGDEELIAYLWRLIGCCLTGFVDYDAIFFFYGSGANGKSTFINTIEHLLGDFMLMMDVEVLLSREAGNQSLDYKKSQMFGRRVVTTTEIPKGKKFNEAQIKSLTGGDRIMARNPYGKPFTFTPTHKLFCVGNHKPEITGTDEGIWRRIHLIPWNVKIPKEKQRARSDVLSDFIKEMPGILWKAVMGYLESKDIGLAPPEAVREASQEYRQEADQVQRFIDECLDPAPALRIKGTDILRHYKRWCEETGETPAHQSARALLPQLRSHGLTTESFNNAQYIMDVELRDE